MEQKLQRTPRNLSFKLLEDITNNFSPDHKVGSGDYGDVYKGVLDTGEKVAVKKLYHMQDLDDEKFEKEINNLMRVEHQNIIRLVGYCYEIRHKHIEIKGEYRFAKIVERALCFEYLQCGSLDKHLSDESCGLDWHTRVKIIKGVCKGLNYLHSGFENHILKPVFHLRMKPVNILLDENMMPKIADFCSVEGIIETRCDRNRAVDRYTPPEYIKARMISSKFDVFSLGVIIIEIIAGSSGYSEYGESEMTPQQFAELVHENWKKRFHTVSPHASYKADSLEVKMCIEMALRCVDADRRKRPTMAEVIDKLNEIETLKNSLVQSSESKDRRVEVDPMELRFPLELNKQISSVLQLRNKSDDFVEFRVKANQSKYFPLPDKEMHYKENEVEDLERIYTDVNAKPIQVSYAVVKSITKNFGQVIGLGAFGVVYLGALRSGLVAVKRLSPSKDLSDMQFLEEVKCLKKVNHKNIVRFLGYCADTQGLVVEVEGKYEIAEVQQRLLCFEYVPNGNLHNYLQEKTHGYEWNTRYRIIKGICQGLHYLRQLRINHLDLKPANVLLGAQMEPQITDFGLSRYIDGNQSTIFTTNLRGTPGYIAPELIDERKISSKSDIYSLGIIMTRLLTGSNESIAENG